MQLVQAESQTREREETMNTTDTIKTALATTRMVKVAQHAWTVDTYDAGRGAWIQGVQLDYHKARVALAECRVFQAARAAGFDACDSESWAYAFTQSGGDWRMFVRTMARSLAN